jgi:hypothetical protein
MDRQINYWISRDKVDNCFILTTDAPHLTLVFENFQDLAFSTKEKVWEFIKAQKQFYKNCKHIISWSEEDSA